MNQMFKSKRQLVRVNSTTFNLITRLDSEQNESVYYKNKSVSFIKIKGDRTHEFDFEGDQYRIQVDNESTVTEVLVNGKSLDFVSDKVKLNPGLMMLFPIALVVGVFMIKYINKIEILAYKIPAVLAFIICMSLVAYSFYKQYRFAYPRKK